MRLGLCSWLEMFATLPLPQLCLSRFIDGIDAHKGKTLCEFFVFLAATSASSALEVCSAGRAQLDVNIGFAPLHDLRHAVDTVQLPVFVCVARSGFEIGTLACEAISVDYLTQPHRSCLHPHLVGLHRSPQILHPLVSLG